MVGSFLHTELRKARLPTKLATTEHLPAKKCGSGFFHIPSPGPPAFQHCVFKPPSSKAHQLWGHLGWTRLSPAVGLSRFPHKQGQYCSP